MTRLRDERGTAVVFMTLSLTVVLGMAALVLDVGSWFREQRNLQATADAATLAAVQAVPDAGQATNLALTYANHNGGGVLAADVQITTTNWPNDTVSVRAARRAPGFFARALSITSVDVEARARARASGASSVRNAAPIVVKESALACIPGCFDSTLIELKLNDETTLSGGAFGLADVARSGAVNTTALVEWITSGFPGSMPAPEWYESISSAKFNASTFESALKAQVGKPLLFPVYDNTKTTTNPPQYHVIGWVGFVIRSAADVKITGNCSNVAQQCFIRGTFTAFVAQGVMNDSAPTFGMRVVALTG